MGFNIMDLMNGATRAAVEGVDNYEAITLNLDEIKVTKIGTKGGKSSG